jgi:hypothetical protein
MLRRRLWRVVGLVAFSSSAGSCVSASTITFDVRDPAIELIDEVNSFSLTGGAIHLHSTLSAVGTHLRRLFGNSRVGCLTKERL